VEEIMISEFKNQPLTDFTDPKNRQAMEGALSKVKSELGREYPSWVAGKELKLGEKLSSINPADPDQVIGVFQKAGKDQAAVAVDAAYETFQTWRFEPPEKRADYLFKAARLMQDRRLELAAWMVLEVGKSWVEADADVAEAIDFLEFYGREMIRYSQPQPLTRIPTEESELIYIPLGVGVVIPPWNFPLAILVGMTSASIVAGNTVVLKPSSDSPTIGYKFFEIMQDVGLPPGVLNFLPGSGGTAGEALVGHPRTRFISFTGSKPVGLRINELAAKVAPGQIWIKRVILEMGGKDAIIVDNEADLADAVQGVSSSAFGFQGQKCSACSRAIVHKDVYDEFLKALVEKAKTVTVGPTDDPYNAMGPVINEAAADTILRYIGTGKKEGRLVLGGKRLDRKGFFIEPTIIADVDRDAVIAQEEIFGPVLAVIKAESYDDALEIANRTEFGLTGSVYTTNREKIEKGKKVFHVGNLYFNRKCTGALVGVHPFGGFNMSGTDSKAGGRDYLLLFTQAKSISEVIKK